MLESRIAASKPTTYHLNTPIMHHRDGQLCESCFRQLYSVAPSFVKNDITPLMEDFNYSKIPIDLGAVQE